MYVPWYRITFLKYKPCIFYRILSYILGLFKKEVSEIDDPILSLRILTVLFWKLELYFFFKETEWWDSISSTEIIIFLNLKLQFLHKITTTTTKFVLCLTYMYFYEETVICSLLTYKLHVFLLVMKLPCSCGTNLHVFI